MDVDWEQRYLAGDTPWDKGAPSPGLIEFLQRRPLDGRILVPGCGFGYDVRAIARPDNRVLGIDIAPSAIAGSRRFPAAASESYRLADYLDLPPDLVGASDWVWEHTCFCAIHPSRRADYARSTRAALRPGGHFLAIFYMNPDHDGDGPPFGVEPAELDALFAGLAGLDLVDDWIPAANYESRSGRERMRLYRKPDAPA